MFDQAGIRKSRAVAPGIAALMILLACVGCGSDLSAAAALAVEPAAPTTPSPTTTASTTTTTTTTTLPPYQRIGVDPDLLYPTIEPVIGISPTTPQPAASTVRVDPLPGTVALTWDDGPDPKWTPVILDILKERGVTATFFVLGWKVDQYPELAKRIVDEGHSLQSHAYRHHNLTTRSDTAVGNLIDDTADAIFNATGTTPLCIRPPRGITSARLRANAAAHGHVVVLWSPQGNTGDYALGSASAVLSRAKKWQAGYVTLMHDTWGWLYRDALNAMIDDLESRGIGFSTICVQTDPASVPTAG